MHKFNKKTITFIIIGIIAIFSIYYFFTNKDYIEVDSNLNVFAQNEKNEQTEEKETNTEEKIIVYITGAIKNEGIYEMEENSRIANIIEKAGGLTEDANIENINLAYLLEDEMKIYIPKKDEKTNEIKEDINTYTSKENSTSEVLKNTNKNEKININTATQTELETLPGIGPTTALRIIEYRKENGKFRNIEDIKKINGIGDNKFSKIKDLIKI